MQDLKRNQRWDDEPYLTRIIFSEMIKDNIEDETGYGISTYICDNSYPILVVDTEKQEVSIQHESRTVSFKNFCELNEEQLLKFFFG